MSIWTTIVHEHRGKTLCGFLYTPAQHWHDVRVGIVPLWLQRAQPIAAGLFPTSLLWQDIRGGPTAPVERAHSDRAHSASERDHPGCSFYSIVMLLILFLLLAGRPDRSPTARNFLTRPPTGTPRRAISPSEGLPDSLYLLGEWPRLPFTARIERPPLHRGGSASKKGTWPLPLHPSQAARCASTGDHQASVFPLGYLPLRTLHFSAGGMGGP